MDLLTRRIMKPLLKHLMQHAHWANQRVLVLLQQHSHPPQRPLQLFAHLLTAEQIYLERMRGNDPWPQDFWPALTLQDCATRSTANHRAYREFLEELATDAIAVAVKYRNSKGIEFHTPIAQQLSHVALHGSYHRGQIAFLMRALEYEPVGTDFILFVRDGHANDSADAASQREQELRANLVHLFHHACWANEHVLQCLQDTSKPPQTAQRLFSHVLAAELVWLTRLRREDSSALAIWPELAMQECLDLAQANAAGYQEYLENLRAEDWHKLVIYRNSQGMEFSTAVIDILMQVALHGAYHRGQIALVLRNAGIAPINTDFITFVREEA